MVQDLVLVTESLVTFHRDDVQQGCQCPLNDEPPNNTHPMTESPSYSFYGVKMGIFLAAWFHLVSFHILTLVLQGFLC